MGRGGEDRRDDDELIESARKGDEEAIIVLIKRHGRSVAGGLHAGGAKVWMADYEDAEGEVLFRVWHDLDRFEGRARFSTWVYGIARNVAREQARASARHRRLIDLATQAQRVEQQLPDPWGPDRVVLWDDQGRGEDDHLARLARQAMGELADIHREVVELHLQGLTYREIADRLHIAENTVGSRLNRAKRQLVAAMGRLFDDG